MATWIWLNVTLCVFAFAAVIAVLPVLALRRAEEQLVPVVIATNTRQYELTDKRQLTGVGV